MKKVLGLGLCLLLVGGAVVQAAVAGDCQTVRMKLPELRTMPLPDLRLRQFLLYGEPVEATVNRDGKTVRLLKQDFRLTVENVGRAPAASHRIQINYAVPGVNNYRLFMMVGRASWFLEIQGDIDPGHSRTINGDVFYEDSFRGTRGEVYALVDVRDEEFMPDYGRVRESDEANNESVHVSVTLPELFRLKEPVLKAQPGYSLNLSSGSLGLCASLLEGRLHLNNDNGHSDSDHFTPNNPFRADDCSIRINDFYAEFNFPETWFKLGAMDYHYYVRDLDATFGGSRGRDLFQVRDGKLVMTIRFETGGRVELRGWEYTGGVFYDLSGPDMDITRLDVQVFLTPLLRDDGIFTYSEARVSTNLQVSFIGAYDTVFMNDILMRARSRITEGINGQLKTFLSSDEAKRNFEVQVMAGLRQWVQSTKGRTINRLTGMTVAGDRITLAYR